MGQSNYVHVTDCNVKRTTDKAVLIEFDDGDDGMKELWVPRSQIDNEGVHLDAGDREVLRLWHPNDARH